MIGSNQLMVEGRCIAWSPQQPCTMCWGLLVFLWAREPEPSKNILTAGSFCRGKTRLFYRSFQPRHTYTPNNSTQAACSTLPSSSPSPPPSSPLPGEPSADKEASEEAAPEVELSTKKPAVVPLPDDLTAMHIDCGAFHTGET